MSAHTGMISRRVELVYSPGEGFDGYGGHMGDPRRNQLSLPIHGGGALTYRCMCFASPALHFACVFNGCSTYMVAEYKRG
jgi:hypothetical protein